MASTRSTNSRRAARSGAAALALIVLAGCQASSGLTSSPVASPIILNASWAKSYASASELALDADSIVLGTVAGIEYQGPDPNDTSGSRFPIALTRFSLTVKAVIAGKPGAVIIVDQTGGIVNGQQETLEGDPLLTVGATYVLYLQRTADGSYYTVGGPQGTLVASADGSLKRYGDSQVSWPVNLTVSQLEAVAGR